MFIVYSFIGDLPDYTIDTIYQTRLYCENDIYLIYNDYSSKYIDEIKKYKNIFLIRYDNINKENLNILKKFYKNFSVINGLGNRKELFYRSFERIYLLYNLMNDINIENVLFMELDNLIYSDPNSWIKNVDKDVAFMIDNFNRISIGVSYFKNKEIIRKILDYLNNEYLKDSVKFPNEMSAFWGFYEKYSSECFILPSFIEPKYSGLISFNHRKFNSIFDPSTYGIFLLGYDKMHGSGINKINKWGIIKDLNVSNVIWKNIDGLKKPYYISNNNSFLINNLHIHSKNLKGGLSK